MPTTDKTFKLNDRQRKFADLVLDGQSQNSAYLQVYGDDSKHSYANAYRLMRHKEVKAYMTEMRELAKSEKVMSIRHKREFLARVVNTPPSQVDPDSDLCQSYTVSTLKNGTVSEKLEMPSKLDAIKTDNRMAGDDSPDKVEHSAGDGLTALLKELSGKTTGLE